MPYEKVNGVIINYQLSGEGKEVLVILNGIMMSTTSWNDIIPAYDKYFRVLRVDFRNQGQSQYVDDYFPIDIHIEDLKQLLDRLGITKASFLGISYGAKVAMLFTLAYPHSVKSLVVCNTTARVTKHLRAIGDSWDEAARLYDGERFFKLVMPFIYSSCFYEKNYKWIKERENMFGRILNKEWFEAYLRLSASTADYDIVDKLNQILTPTLCIASSMDIITPVAEVRMIHEGIPNSSFVIIPDAGHACCYERKEEFNTAVLGFLLHNR